MNNNKIYILAFFSAICSIGYELLLASSLSIITGNVILWESLTIGIFISTVGLGCLSKLKRYHTLWDSLYYTELGLIICSLLSLPIIWFLSSFYRYLFADAIILLGEYSWYAYPFLLCSIIPIATLGFLSGKEMCVLLKAPSGGNIALILSVYYFGTFSGSLLFYCFLHKFSPLNAMIALAIGNLLIAYFIHTRTHQPKYYLWLTTILLIIVAQNSHDIAQYFKRDFYYNIPKWGYNVDGSNWNDRKPPWQFLKISNHLPYIKSIISSYNNIDFVKRDNDHFALYLNNKLQFDSRSEKYYHQVLADWPQQLGYKTPQKVLILGGGDGLLARNLYKKKSNINITLVDIDRQMIALSKYDPQLRRLNQGAMDHVKVINQDAFIWLKRQTTKYHAIYIDFPLPTSFDAQRLYSLEFFRLVYSHLYEKGYLVADYPLQVIKINKTKYHWSRLTLQAVGFTNIKTLHQKNEGFVFASKSKKHHTYKLRLQPNSILKPLKLTVGTYSL